MEGSERRYVENTIQFPSAGLTIRQKEPKNLEAPFDQIELIPHSPRAVLHPQPFSDTSPGPCLLSTTHRRCGQASIHIELRRAVQHAVRDPGGDFGVRRQ